MSLAEIQAFWLDELEDLFAPISERPHEPLCFLIGAGASLSSDAPSTAKVVAALRSGRPRLFSSDAAVYERVHLISHEERAGCLDPLFADIVPFFGYRYLGALARTRPIIVVNLNWDDCVRRGALAAGVPRSEVTLVDLQDVDEAGNALQALLTRERGILSLHLHGFLADPKRHDVRFGIKETLEFGANELALLRRCLSLRTIIVGTSLSGPHDAGGLLDALAPRDQDQESGPLWVVERGPGRRDPGTQEESARQLSQALIARRSIRNFLASPAVDFDLFMAALRATETGRTWERVVEQAGAQLPARAELVMPNAAPLRRILDSSASILVARPLAGKTRVAYLMGWLMSLLGESGPLQSTSGPEFAAHAVSKLGGLEPAERQVLVLEECFGQRSHRPRPALVSGLAGLSSQTASVIATASPGVWMEAKSQAPGLEELEVVKLLPAALWSTDALRAYVAHRAPLAAGDLVQRIEAGELVAPDELDRALAELPKIDDENDYVSQLVHNLERLREHEPSQALLVALARMQVFSHGRPLRALAELAQTSQLEAAAALAEPWGLLGRYSIDGEDYVRLTTGVVVTAVDTWLLRAGDWVAQRLAAQGEAARWAMDALDRWRIFSELEPTPQQTCLLAAEHRELFASELVEGALRRSAAEATAVLEVLCEQASDFWALRDATLSLVMNWEKLHEQPRARNLRDRVIADEQRLGAYGLLECLLRRGGKAPLDLWMPVCARLLDLSRTTRESDSARHQTALCFDALLWRPAPVGPEEHRSLLQELLLAGEHDDILEAAYAEGAAYHYNAARELRALGLRNPIDELSGTTPRQAEEMAWMVAWHFLHQSRIRSLASKRDFRSTRNDPGAERTRYLDRGPCENELDADHARAILRAAGELARFPATAGWAVHFVVNAHATLGSFAVPKLDEWLASTAPDDDGLIGAAITYGQHPDVHRRMLRSMSAPRAQEALLAALGEGVSIAGTRLRPPRFLAVSDPWKVRGHWGVETETLERLGLPFADPWDLIELFRASRASALAAGASEVHVDLFLGRLECGDTRSLYAVVSRVSPGQSDGTRSGGVPDVTQLLVSASEALDLRLF